MQYRKRWLAAASLAAGSLVYTTVDNAESGVDSARVELTRHAALKPSTSSSSQDAALLARGLRVSSRDARHGRPTFLWAAQPEATSKPLSAPSRAAAIDAARQHVAKLADVYGIEPEDALKLPVRHAQVGAATIVRLGAEVDGIEVFRSELAVVMNSELSLVALSGHLPSSDMLEAAEAHTPVLGAQDALKGALKQDAVTQQLTFTQLDEAGPYTRFRLASGGKAAGTARVKRVFMEQAKGLVPAYYVEVDGPSSADSEPNYRARVIDARKGATLFENRLVAADAFQYRVFAEATPPYTPVDGPSGDATPHPTSQPDGYQPGPQSASLITLQNVPFSRDDPWLPRNSQVLAGNNVWAYLDIAAPDGFQRDADLEVTATAQGAFDYTYNPSLPPQATPAQRAAAATHAFHVTNFLHDRFYDAGFDESAGNAQASNYGRGGLGDDRLLVEVHDHARRNSSRAVVPADGASPRIELGLYAGPAVLTITAPAGAAGTYNVVAASDIGPQVYDLSARVVLPSASSAAGCGSLAGEWLEGHIVLLDAGECDVALKAEHAQAAGAVALLVAGADTHVAAALEGSSTSISIPVLSLTGRLASAIKQSINQQAEVQVQLSRADFDRDAALDTSLIAHEWGHVMTRRLVGDGSGLENAQGRAIDEGYADFIALWTVAREQDRNVWGNNNWQGVYAVGGHVAGAGVTDGHYFGLRRVPYSTDMSKNALTFKHVVRGASLPGTHPVAAASSTAGTDNASPHHSGEVWATMLWECYASLLNAHPFQESQDRMQRYVVSGLRATPIDPTFVEARDALLAAAAASDPADFQRFRNAFAKRGLGVGAVAPARDALDHAGVVESYASGDVRLVLTDVQLRDSGGGCADGVLDLNEPGQLRLTVTNRGTGYSNSNNVSVSGRSGTQLHFPNTDQAYVPSLAPGASATVSLPVVLSALTGTQAALALAVPSAWGLSETHNVVFPANWQAQPASSAEETFDVAGPEWAASPAAGARSFQRVSTREGARYYHASALAGPGEAMLLSPPIAMAASGESALDFRMRHSFEDDLGRAPYRTGMVIEVSVDGAPFEDVAFDEDPGYSGVVHAASQNPLAGRPAFVGSSEGYPADWQTVSVNLGSRYAGRTLRFRFRLGTDGTGSTYGVDIDNFSVSNAALLFATRVAKPAAAGACNLPPVVNAGPDQRVSEFEGNPADGVRRLVQLSAQSSFDPDGDALSYHWKQVFGPPVTLSASDEPNVSFTANVNADATLIFELTVSDGVNEVRDYVEVEVKHLALTPVAQITGEASVSERSGLVTLSGTSSSHPEGHALSYHWTQASGPSVSFDASAASIEFMPPEVDADTTLSFSLVVTADGVDSAPASFTLTVLEVDRAPSVSVASDALTLQAGALATALAAGVDPDGTAVSYVWTQTAGPDLTLYGANEARVFFAAPEVSSTTAFTLEVRAHSGGLESEPASITFEVSPRPIGDRAPEVSLASKLECQAGERCSLRASASDPDGDALTYSWVQLTGPKLILQSSTSDTLTFDAPEFARATVYGFALTVTANGASTSAGVIVVVHPVERAPDAGVVDPGEEPEPNGDAGVGPGDEPGDEPGEQPGDDGSEPKGTPAGNGCSVSANGGGASAWQFLAGLFGLAALRRRRRRA